MKVYTVTLEWLFDDNQGLEIEIFDTYEKAKNYFYNAIKNEQNPDNSWVGDMAFENGELQDGYELDCSPDYRDNDIHAF